MPTKDEALEKIRLLIQRFEEQKEFYTNSDYNETQTRRDFVDPLQLYRDLPSATLPSQREQIQSKIDYSEDRIDT